MPHSLTEVRSHAFMFLMALTCVLTGCSSSDPQSGTTTGGYYPQDVTSPLWQELSSASLTCAPGSKCPEAVGMIYVNTTDQYERRVIGTCSGFLVAENVVATNRHCLPKYIRTAGASCDGQVLMRFTKENPQEIEIHSCKRILSVSSETGFGPDYAFFEIGHTGRRPLVVSRQGIQDRQTLRSIRVRPLTTGYVRGGIIEFETCNAALGTMLNMTAATPWSPTGIAMGCSVQHGNSGSPVLNENGEAIGVLQSFAGEDYGKFITRNFQQFGIEMPSVIPSHFNFTNLTCVQDPVTGAAVDSQCGLVANDNIFSCVDWNNEHVEAESKRKLLEWIDQLPEIFAYLFVTDEASGVMEAKPDCVVPKSGHEQEHRKYITAKGVSGFRNETIRTNFQYSALLKPKLQVGADTRLLPMTYGKTVYTERTLELKKNGSFWDGELASPERLSDYDILRLGRLSPGSPIKIKECTAAQLQAKLDHKSPGFIRTKSGELLDEKTFMLRNPPQAKRSCSAMK